MPTTGEMSTSCSRLIAPNRQTAEDAKVANVYRSKASCNFGAGPVTSRRAEPSVASCFKDADELYLEPITTARYVIISEPES